MLFYEIAELIQLFVRYLINKTSEFRSVLLVSFSAGNHKIQPVGHINVAGVTHLLGQLDNGRG